jgi:L-fuconate dehydratase
MSTKITSVTVRDIRFPTSRALDGSDAMNLDPDYSAPYVVLETDHPDGLQGHGLTFTNGRGTEVCVAAVRALSYTLDGKTLEELTSDLRGFWRSLVGDTQIRWLGPEKGVVHLATAALVNAVWDLWAKVEGKPLWRLIADMEPEHLVQSLDFRYVTDVLTPEEAVSMLSERQASRAERVREIEADGYPAYTTSVGWLGYGDEKIRQLCREGVAEGWRHFKMKVGLDLEDDQRRAEIVRSAIGDESVLMIDANQAWDVDEAIEWVRGLAAFDPWFIEEPTSPDDILGHARIAEAIRPVLVATGEHAHNRVMFKQFFQAGALDVCQLDCCRLGGISEALVVYLMAEKFEIPVCPHAGGVGLCEYVQHLAMADYVSISAKMDDRLIEYVDHLHEHFLDPVVVERGRYVAPSAPGCSIEMRPESLSQFEFPDGPEWRR